MRLESYSPPLGFTTPANLRTGDSAISFTARAKARPRRRCDTKAFVVAGQLCGKRAPSSNYSGDHRRGNSTLLQDGIVFLEAPFPPGSRHSCQHFPVGASARLCPPSDPRTEAV